MPLDCAEIAVDMPSTKNALRQDLGRAQVGSRADGNSLLYIDLQLLHEVTSPQAFEGLQLAGRPVACRCQPGDARSQCANLGARTRSLVTDEVALEQVVTQTKTVKHWCVTV